MGDSGATSPTKHLRLGGSESKNEDDYEEPLIMELIDTPDVEETKKYLEGKETEPLAQVIMSYPINMKDTILKHSVKMLSKWKKNLQKNRQVNHSDRAIPDINFSEQKSQDKQLTPNENPNPSL